MYRRILSLLTLLVLLTSSLYGTVAAVSCEADSDTCPYTQSDLQSFVNNTPFYDETEESTCSATGDDGRLVQLTGIEAGAQVFNFLTQNGFTAIQAAGIIGNMQHESGIDPLKLQGGKRVQVPAPASKGWGIVQWTPNTKITDYAKLENKPAYELSTQLEFLLKQLNGTAPFSNEKAAGDDVRSTTTLEDAVRAFQGDSKIGGKYNGYERPASESGSLADRIGAAKVALSTYGSGAPAGTVNAGTPTTTPSAAATSSCGGAGAVAGSAVQTAINYAWADYHKAPYLEFKPSYQAAIKKAQAAGEYVGGGSHPGVDCGGFITRVMRDSGADPNYNWGPSDSRQGNTDSQMAYMEANPDKYEKLGAKTDSTGLQPGDIAINGSHTYMWVGDQPNFHGNSASASFSTSGESWRTPMASSAYWSNESGPFIWYRLKA